MPPIERNGRIKKSMQKMHSRSRALWAFILAAIGFSGTVIGLVQYLSSGIVSIRPGHDMVSGSDAMELLITLTLVSCGFLGIGLYLLFKPRR